jgi:hypothetical protein
MKQLLAVGRAQSESDETGKRGENAPDLPRVLEPIPISPEIQRFD